MKASRSLHRLLSLCAAGRLNLQQARPYDVRYRRYVQLLGEVYDEQMLVEQNEYLLRAAIATMSRPGVAGDKAFSLFRQYQERLQDVAWPWLQFNTSIADTGRMVDAYKHRFGDLSDPEVRKTHEAAAAWWIENSHTKRTEKLRQLMQEKIQVRRTTRRTAKRLSSS